MERWEKETPGYTRVYNSSLPMKTAGRIIRWQIRGWKTKPGFIVSLHGKQGTIGMSHFQRVGMALELPSDSKEGPGGHWGVLEFSVLECREELIPLFTPGTGRNQSQAPPNHSWLFFFRNYAIRGKTNRTVTPTQVGFYSCFPLSQ